MVFTPTDSTDYNSATSSVTLTVNPAVLTVTAANASRAYGATNPQFTASISGFVNGDASSAVTGSASLTTTATASSTVGTYPITASLGTLAAANYSFSFVNGTLSITQVTPAITWAAPAAIAYGTPLNGAQLNATSTAAGTFTYTPAAGAVLSAGSQRLSVVFTPTDSTDYNSATSSVTLTVNPAVLTVTAANASRAYGAANPQFTSSLSGFVNGDTSSAVTGSANLTTTATASSTVGTYPITASLGTLAAANYSFAFVNGTLSITQVTPAITWAAPAAITYGTALSRTQLNATASVPGTFVYTPAAGAVLTAGPQTLSVQFTPTDSTDYAAASSTVQLQVNPAKPVITWTSPAAITYGAALTGTQLNATASVPGAFVYTPATGAVLTVGTQTLSVQFTPTDTADYTTASYTVQLQVNPAKPLITWATRRRSPTEPP